MSCYFRHMKNLLDKAGIEVTPSNKRKIDQAFRQIVSVTYRDCPTTWKKLKQDMLGDEQNQSRPGFLRLTTNHTSLSPFPLLRPR